MGVRNVRNIFSEPLKISNTTYIRRKICSGVHFWDPKLLKISVLLSKNTTEVENDAKKLCNILSAKQITMFRTTVSRGATVLARTTNPENWGVSCANFCVHSVPMVSRNFHIYSTEFIFCLIAYPIFVWNSLSKKCKYLSYKSEGVL